MLSKFADKVFVSKVNDMLSDVAQVRHMVSVARSLWQALSCLSVWHGVGRGARALCAILDQCLPLHTEHTQDSHTRLYLLSMSTSISLYLSPAWVPHFPFSFHFCACVFVHVGWLAMPSVPSAATPPPHSSPTLLTHHKGGLNHLCVSVFPRWEKGECGHSGGNRGCHNRHKCKLSCMLRLIKKDFTAKGGFACSESTGNIILTWFKLIQELSLNSIFFPSFLWFMLEVQPSDNYQLLHKQYNKKPIVRV